MAFQQDLRNPLLLIPPKKVESAIRNIIDSFPDCKGKSISGGLSAECAALVEAIRRYANANIPVDYWFLDMDEFQGDKALLKQYNESVKDIKSSYAAGFKCCFAGNHGVGKTMSSACILKRAVEAGFSGLYVNLTDIVNVMTSSNSEDKYSTTQVLRTVDFLVIDEFDPRFMGSEQAADLYGRILEPTLRARIQNKLPLILCTNSPNPVSGFSGSLKQSISSLMGMVKLVPVLGDDFRKKIKNGN